MQYTQHKRNTRVQYTRHEKKKKKKRKRECTKRYPKTKTLISVREFSETAECKPPSITPVDNIVFDSRCDTVKIFLVEKFHEESYHEILIKIK